MGNVGVVGRAHQVVGEGIDTEGISRDLEEVHKTLATAAIHPSREVISTGVVGRTAQQIAEVHEQSTLERDLHQVHGAAHAVSAGAATTENLATGKIDEAT